MAAKHFSSSMDEGEPRKGGAPQKPFIGQDSESSSHLPPEASQSGEPQSAESQPDGLRPLDSQSAAPQSVGQPGDTADQIVPEPLPNPYDDDLDQDIPYVPYNPATASDNPYVDGPTSGAVGVVPENVGPRSRKKKSHHIVGAPGVPAVSVPHRHIPLGRIAIFVVGILACVGVYFLVNPPIYSVTVNGVTHSVDSGMTLEDMVKKGYVSPQAGNLIAVDGSVAKQGGGEPFEANVNGTVTADPQTKLPRGATIQFEDGGDTNETFKETTETIPHGDAGDTDINSKTAYWAGSIHVYSDGVDGEKTTRTGDVSGKIVTKVTKQPVGAGYHVYTADVGKDKVIALTFDDGPWPTTTSEILDILKENDAKATFFEIGKQVAPNADVVKRIHDEGHQIASHTYDHAEGSGRGVDLTRMSTQEQIDEVDKGFQAINDTLGTEVERVLRAPGGNYHGTLIENLKDHAKAEIGWNVDTEDWRKPGADKIEAAIMSVKPGQVILMHDGGGDRSETVTALKVALPKLKAEGYSFVTIDDILAYGMPASE